MLRLGAVVVEHNPLYTSRELRHQFEDHQARIVIAWDKAAAAVRDFPADVGIDHVVSVNLLAAFPAVKRLALHLPVKKLRDSREALTGPAPGTTPWKELLSHGRISAAEMEGALIRLQSVVPARTLVVHTKYWSAAIGQDACGYAGSLQGGITMASTRFSRGDDFTAADYQAVGLLPANSAGVEFSTAIEERLGSRVRCIPALALDPAVPTTIGLGDSFVGGFIAALASTEFSRGGDAVLYG